MIGHIQIKPCNAAQRTREFRGLPQRVPIDQAQNQGRLNGEVGILERRSTLTAAPRNPCIYGIVREQQGDIATSHQGLVVLSLVADPVLGFAFRVDS